MNDQAPEQGGNFDISKSRNLSSRLWPSIVNTTSLIYQNFGLLVKMREGVAVTENNARTNAGGPVSAEERLLAAGIVLPAARAPIANFVGGVLQGNLLFLSGQGPVTAEGKMSGKVGRSVTAQQAYGHARLAGLNLLSQMRSILGSLDRVSRIVKVLEW